MPQRLKPGPPTGGSLKLARRPLRPAPPRCSSQRASNRAPPKPGLLLTAEGIGYTVAGNGDEAVSGCDASASVHCVGVLPDLVLESAGARGLQLVEERPGVAGSKR